MVIHKVNQNDLLNTNTNVVEQNYNHKLTVNADINVTKEHHTNESNNKVIAKTQSNNELKGQIIIVRQIKNNNSNDTTASNEVESDVNFIQNISDDKSEDILVSKVDKKGSVQYPNKDLDEILNVTKLTHVERTENADNKSYNRFEMVESDDNSLEKSLLAPYILPICFASFLYLFVLSFSILYAVFKQNGK